MKKAILVLANGFEEGEMILAHDVILRGGVDLKTVSIHESTEVISGQNLKVMADYTIHEYDKWDEIDVLVIPGGLKGVNNLRACSKLIEVIKGLYKRDALLAAVCAGPLVLDKAGVLTEHHFTSYPSVQPNFAAKQYEATPGTIVDGNIITSQSVGTSFTFTLAILQKLVSDEKVKHVERIITIRDIKDIKYY